MNYYQRLKDVREDHDKNQTEIAEILQIQQTQYSRYELGKQMMGIDKYIKLAKYYNVSLDYLAGIKDTPESIHRDSSATTPDSLFEKEVAKEIKRIYKKYYGESKNHEKSIST